MSETSHLPSCSCFCQ